MNAKRKFVKVITQLIDINSEYVVFKDYGSTTLIGRPNWRLERDGVYVRREFAENYSLNYEIPFKNLKSKI